MNPIKLTLQALIFISGLALISGTIFHFEKKIPQWQNIRLGLMIVCGIGFISFLVIFYKVEEGKKVKEMVLIAGILLLITAMFYFFA